MGVTNFDNLIQNLPVTKLVDAQQISKERKSAQRIAGASLRYFTSETADTFDWSGQLTKPTGSVDFGYETFEVLLTSETVSVPLVDAALKMFASENSGATWDEYTYADSASESRSPFVGHAMSFDIIRSPGATNGPGESRWFVSVVGFINHYAAFKIQVAGMDEVTISVTRTV